MACLGQPVWANFLLWSGGSYKWRMVGFFKEKRYERMRREGEI